MSVIELIVCSGILRSWFTFPFSESFLDFKYRLENEISRQFFHILDGQL